MKLKKIKKRLRKLEAFSHEPQDIAPRIHNELERLAILGRLFEYIATEDLETASQLGLDTYTYRNES